MPKFLYKYTPHNTCYKYDIITKNELWFAKIESLNDPMDTNLAYRQEYKDSEIKNYWEQFLKNKPNYPKNLDEILQQYGKNATFVEQQNRINELFRSQMGVLCMSANPLNIAMWSHYANNHKGVVYEFESNLFADNTNAGFNGFYHEINYCTRYDLKSYCVDSETMKQDLVNLLLTKGVDWIYEQEYRFVDLKFNGAKKFDKNCLKSIIFGVKTNIDEIKCVKECCKKHGLNHVNFKQTKFIPGKFELEMVDI